MEKIHARTKREASFDSGHRKEGRRGVMNLIHVYLISFRTYFQWYGSILTCLMIQFDHLYVAYANKSKLLFNVFVIFFHWAFYDMGRSIASSLQRNTHDSNVYNNPPRLKKHLNFPNARYSKCYCVHTKFHLIRFYIQRP